MTSRTGPGGAPKALGIYVHIPFCVKKCGYCDFLSFCAGEDERTAYVEALIREIKAAADASPKGYTVSTVFVGGGTPSILDGDGIRRILGTIRDVYHFSDDVEITVECNPGTLDSHKLEAYRAAGVNRLSMGLQSADDLELLTLGRIHTFADFIESFGAARDAGFDNINIDLISAVPGQTFDSWKDTLSKTADLKPEHISAYSLIIEEGTPFFRKYAEGAPFADMLPDEDEDRRMYAYTKDFLSERGYERYEISNYALPGRECRHNLSYWERVDYKGFGLGASSLLENTRYKNTSDFAAYLKSDFSYEEVLPLSENDILEERMFLGLRKTKGMRLDSTLERVYGGLISKLESEGLVERGADNVRLTDYGTDISNYVFALFLL